MNVREVKGMVWYFEQLISNADKVQSSEIRVLSYVQDPRSLICFLVAAHLLDGL